MADKKKKSKASESSAKKTDEAVVAKAAPKAEVKAEEKVTEKAEETVHAKEAHDDVAPAAKPAHGDAHAAHAHAGHAPNRKEYLIIFALLALLTALEVGVAKVPGISKNLMGLALVGLALTKAAMVGMYFMHLKHETKFLRYTVALPMLAPTLYAFVLISEAAWRLTR